MNRHLNKVKIPDPDGYFDVSEGGKKYLGWTVGMESYPAEEYWDEYYRPGLLAEVMKAE